MKQKIHLLDLPQDIHDTIVEQLLLGVPEPLFTPIYKNDDKDENMFEYSDCGNLKNKCNEYYGKRSSDQIESVQALLDWSLTCRFFRKLLAPRLFRSVILRSRPKSMASIKALMKSEYWDSIWNFTFVGTEYEFNEDSELIGGEKGTEGSEEDHYVIADIKRESWQPENPEEDEKVQKSKTKGVLYDSDAEMSSLREIMSNLPTGLRSLTLDFPNAWIFEPWTEQIMEVGVWKSGGLEDGRRYRAQLQTVISATSSNDIRSKTEFELRLLSVPIVHCPAFESKAFHKFLGHVTSFVLGPCHWDNGAGWHMNVYGGEGEGYMGGDAGKLARNFSKYFFDHLKKVKTLHFLADSSWPLGDTANGNCQMNVTFPKTAKRMPVLEHVLLKNFFVGNQLREFLLMHIDNLRTIELVDVCAMSDDSDESISWFHFLEALADKKPEKLIEFRINNSVEDVKDLIGEVGEKRDYEKKEVPRDRKKVYKILADQKAELEALDPSDDQRKSLQRRHRKVFNTVDLWEKYGTSMALEETNIRLFLEGDLHEVWLELVELIEENTRKFEASEPVEKSEEPSKSKNLPTHAKQDEKAVPWKLRSRAS